MPASSESQSHPQTNSENPESEGREGSPGRAAEAKLTVATWNVLHGIDVDGAIETITSHDELLDADVLLLQEMDEPGTARIAEALSASYVYQPGSVHKVTGRDFGNAVVSRHPLTEASVVRLPHQVVMRGEPRVAVGCEVATPRGPIHAFSVHTEIPTLPLRYRVRQFATIADACVGTSPVIVGGDFNTLTRRGVAAARAEMARVGLHHVHPGAPTMRWPSLNSTRSVGLKVDHLFVRGLQSVDGGVVAESNASDHLPMWAAFEFDA